MPATEAVPATCAAAVATSRSDRSPGVMSNAPGVRWPSTFGSCAAPTTKPSTSRPSAVPSPATTVASSAAATSATVGAPIVGTSGMT